MGRSPTDTGFDHASFIEASSSIIEVPSTLNIKLTRSAIERLERKAGRLGLSVEEYVLDLLLRDLDPHERAQEYIEASKGLLDQAREELAKGNVRQAAEKLWGATALAIKAYAEWRDGRGLASHGELWRYKDVVADELGEWVRDSWNAGNSMHTCFYEGWCTPRDVESSMTKVERLVREVEGKISSHT